MENTQPELDSNLEQLNSLFDRFRDRCSDGFHNALWQIMINRSCQGAFTYIYSEGFVGVAVPGGYVSCYFDIPNPADRKEILDALNETVFGLDPREADTLIGQSIFAIHV